MSYIESTFASDFAFAEHCARFSYLLKWTNRSALQTFETAIRRRTDYSTDLGHFITLSIHLLCETAGVTQPQMDMGRV